MDVIKVSSHSSVSAAAGAIASALREDGQAQILVVGAGALNQAIKAVIIARGFLTPEGMDAVVIPSFEQIEISSVQRTAIRLLVQSR